MHDADELVAHPAAGLRGLHRLVGPQVTAADGGARHPHESVGRPDQMRVGNVLDTDIARAIHDSCAHTQPVALTSENIPSRV
jgi:hypothetical protein